MSFYYLATPYSKYPHPRGIDAAFEDASIQASLLVRNGIPVYCPIAHTHPIAIYGKIDPFDHTIWLEADRTFMEAAKGLVVCMMDGWDKSYGISVEIEHFKKAGKPIYYMTPNTIPEELTSDPSGRVSDARKRDGVRHKISPADRHAQRDIAACDPFYRGTD